MIVLGIAPAHHDPSACLVRDGSIISVVEQERITREKHAVGSFPIEAIEEVIDLASVSFSDIDAIATSRNYDQTRRIFAKEVKAGLRSDLPLKKKGIEAFGKPVQRLLRSNEDLKAEVRGSVNDHFDLPVQDVPPIHCLNHHLTHAASAYYPSGFDDALVVSLDNHGDHLATAIYTARNGTINERKTFHQYNSLGAYYGALTEFIGFRSHNGEGKVMGLAPYGQQNDLIDATLTNYCSVGEGEYDVTELTYRQKDDRVPKLSRDLNMEPRYWDDEITQEYKDLAYHGQAKLEEIVTDLVSYYVDETGLSNVCLAGGVALNCKMNRRIRKLEGVDGIFVQPVANDAGGSIGGALELSERRGYPTEEMTHVYYGSSYDSETIRKTLDRLKVDYTEPEDVCEVTAAALEQGALVGWFQGSMEAGPRALGNRSILADPRDEASLDRVNKFVKHREEWRPFSPSMLPSAAETYLQDEPSKAARFMIDTFASTERAREDIPAVLHPSDKTMRPQIVLEDTNPRYHRLISEFEERTGVGVVLNTSFNDSGEPIVRTPREAVRDFYGMGLDLLVLGDFVIRKRDVSSANAGREAAMTER
ncbi:carbamoyltransferase [Natronomonas halophila]|uniref:carbamoyltransferase family protein n=1 Tax=Natronomonas halophila TaxID=2747817 RepID=UPI0015B52DEE|nr:carbamoyltransferase C-terminal domain-containing protein [Natronomonas halophila]QLD86841.1 carbamoyltransferase [Natronomonas halophila]